MSKWSLFFHMGSVFGFLMSHGTGVAMAFRLRKERDPVRIRALLELSYFWVGMLHVFMFLILSSGVVLGFVGRWWGFAWIWTSIGILVGLWIAMGILGTPYYDRVRRGVGTAPFYGSKKAAQLPEVAPAELQGLLDSGRPVLLTVMGLGGLLIILYLMIFKPF